jgi:hypothetical protein
MKMAINNLDNLRDSVGAKDQMIHDLLGQVRGLKEQSNLRESQFFPVNITNISKTHILIIFFRMRKNNILIRQKKIN